MSELPRELERALTELDARAARAAGRVDPEGVAARVLARLRTEELVPRGFFSTRVRLGPLWMPRWAELAAAASVIVVAASLAAGALAPRGDAPGRGLAVAAPAIETLSDSELESVLRLAGEVRPAVADSVAPAAVAGAWDELSEDELRALLQQLERVGGETP